MMGRLASRFAGSGVSLGSVVLSATLAATVSASVVALPPDRGDLGAAYLRFERAVAAAPRDAAVRREANLAFDALTGDFFAGRFDRALAKLAEIEGDLAQEPANAPSRAERAFLAAHRFECSPRLAEASSTTTFTVCVTRLDSLGEAAAAGDALDGEHVRRTPPTALVWKQGTREMVLEVHALVGEISMIATPPFAEGAVEVFARMKALGDVSIGRVFLLPSDPAELRDTLNARLETLASRNTTDASSLATLRARHELAFGAFDRAKSADLLADPCAIARSLEYEISAIETGARPYRRAGDLWRVLRVLGTEMPIRQFVPEGDGPFPLIVAFHGAGGDENLFFDGYGGGELLKLAKANGCAVVCPPTIPFGVSPNVLPKFLEVLATDVPFDPTRVGLLGHSLGAVTASRLAVLKPTLIHGVVAIAGFSDVPRKVDAPPRRVYLAELDPLFPLASMRATIEAAKSRGEAIECIEVANEGHTLVVGEVLRQAVEWLLTRQPRATAKTPPTQSAPTTAPMNTEGLPPRENTASPSAGPMK